jgi:metal-responsive CopG/Arc/MetJ family transcriptional regulator
MSKRDASEETICYNMAMARRQTLVQLTDDLLALLDERAARSGRSRSEIIRSAIERELATEREAAIDEAIVEGYMRIPPSEDDRWANAAGKRSIAAERW